MSLAPVVNPYQPIVGLTGIGLTEGAMYIGVDGMDPQTSPQACFWDEAGATPAAQPIDILGGYPMRLGTPSRLYTAATYSIRVRDKNGSQVFYESHAVPGPTTADGVFVSRAAAAAAVIPPALRSMGLTILGYATPGDRGGAVYTYSGTNPGHPGSFQSVDGACWVLSTSRPIPEMFGAKGDGATDDQAALADLITYCEAVGAAGYIPARQYNHSSILTIDAMSFVGDGPDSRLHASDGANSCIYMTGSAPALINLRLSSAGGGRLTTNDANGVTVVGATGFMVQGCYVDNQRGAGILMAGAAAQGRVVNNHITGTKADGIHHTEGTSFVTTSGNTVIGTGDDCIAVVSYVANGITCRHISITGNICANGLARGIAVIGGSYVDITGNNISGAWAMGVNVDSEGAFNTYAAKNITISGNIIEGCVVSTGPFSGATINVGGRAGSANDDGVVVDLLCSEIVISGNQINGNGGVRQTYQLALSAFSSDVVVDGNQFSNCTNGAMVLANGAGAVIRGNKFENNSNSYGVVVAANATGVITIESNSFYNMTSRVTSLEVNANTLLVVLRNNRASDGSNGATTGYFAALAREKYAALGNILNNIVQPDLIIIQKSGATFLLDLSLDTNAKSNNSTLVLPLTGAEGLKFRMAYLQIAELSWMIHRDANQWLRWKEIVIYRLWAQYPTPTKMDGTAGPTAGVDYVDIDGVKYMQRFWVDTPVTNGTWGSFALSYAGGDLIDLTYTPPAAVETNLQARVNGFI